MRDRVSCRSASFLLPILTEQEDHRELKGGNLDDRQKFLLVTSIHHCVRRGQTLGIAEKETKMERQNIKQRKLLRWGADGIRPGENVPNANRIADADQLHVVFGEEHFSDRF